MIEIILVSHGKLAEGVLDSGKMIYADIENVKTAMLSNMFGIENFTHELKNTIDNSDNDILIMCDLQGGSPFNVSLELAIKNYSNKNIRVISGLNLPMFLETIALRELTSLDNLVEIALNSGKNGVFAPKICVD